MYRNRIIFQQREYNLFLNPFSTFFKTNVREEKHYENLISDSGFPENLKGASVSFREWPSIFG